MTDTNVFFFVPNLIGYWRIALAGVSFYFIMEKPLISVYCYAMSALLDLFDGMAARYLNQSSRFGAMLDQLTDRCALMVFCTTLGHIYPRYMIWFQLSAVIDISSHWLHLHASDLTGSSTHKQSSNPILHLYYTSRPFLTLMCAGNEGFYLSLYLFAFYDGPEVFGLPLLGIFSAAFFPLAVLKSLISLVHLVTASQSVVQHDVQNILKKE